MPFQPFFFPVFIPFFLCTRTNKELHFHLLKLAHTENKLAGYNLIPERFTNLCNTKRNFKPCRFLYVQKVYEYTLRCFRPQVNNIIIRIISGNGAKLGLKHQVKLPDV